MVERWLGGKEHRNGENGNDQVECDNEACGWTGIVDDLVRFGSKREGAETIGALPGVIAIAGKGGLALSCSRLAKHP